MKIIKTANGNKISITKKEWLRLGQEGGWLTHQKQLERERMQLPTGYMADTEHPWQPSPEEIPEVPEEKQNAMVEIIKAIVGVSAYLTDIQEREGHIPDWAIAEITKAYPAVSDTQARLVRDEVQSAAISKPV